MQGDSNPVARLSTFLRPRAARLVSRWQRSQNPMPHSLGLWPSNHARAIAEDSCDIVNLHWVCGEMMSIPDIGRITKPMVWTLHDSWPFCGTEHHPEPSHDERYLVGYRPDNRPPGHSGIDLDAWNWRRKRKSWTRPIRLISPSAWLAACAARSVIARDWPIEIIPNPLPTQVYRPMPASLGRAVFSLPDEAPLVLFGAVGGALAKGWDLLELALRHVSARMPLVRAVVVGQREPRRPPDIGMPIHFVGRLGDDAALALLYGAVDVVVIPSRVENLPQMGTEAQACGTPVVAFNCCGLPEVVEHEVTGYLAKPYEPADLAEGVLRVLGSRGAASRLRQASAERAASLWSERVIVPQYVAAYSRSMESS